MGRHLPGQRAWSRADSEASAHAGGCCTRWDEARATALKEGRGEPTEVDRLMVNDPPAARLAMAQQRLDRAHAAGAYPQQIEQLQMRVRACEAGVESARGQAPLQPGTRGWRPAAGANATWTPPSSHQAGPRRAGTPRQAAEQMNAHDPYEAFLSAPWPRAPAAEPDDPEMTFAADEAALGTGSPRERWASYHTALLQAFGLAGPDAEAGT